MPTRKDARPAHVQGKDFIVLFHRPRATDWIAQPGDEVEIAIEAWIDHQTHTERVRVKIVDTVPKTYKWDPWLTIHSHSAEWIDRPEVSSRQRPSA